MPLTPDRNDRVRCTPPLAPVVVGVEAREGVRFKPLGDADVLVGGSRPGVPDGGFRAVVDDMMLCIYMQCLLYDVCAFVQWKQRVNSSRRLCFGDCLRSNYRCVPRATLAAECLAGWLLGEGENGDNHKPQLFTFLCHTEGLAFQGKCFASAVPPLLILCTYLALH